MKLNYRYSRDMENEQKEKETSPKKKSIIKKIAKIFLYIIIGIIALNLALYGLLSIPSVQKKVVDYAIAQLKPIVKTELRIDEVRLKLFNNVNLKGVYIEDQTKDTLLYASNLEVSLSPWKLLKSELLINAIDVDDFTIHISQKNPDADFNFQFLIDAFAGDTTAVDTTSSSLKINIEDIKLRNGKLKYDVLSENTTPNEFNASHIHIYDLNADLNLPSIDTENLKATLTSLSLKEHSGLEVKNLKAEVTSDKSTYFIKDAELELPASKLIIPFAKYNIETNEFAVNSEPSVLSPNDLKPFMADLKQLKNDIKLQASITGKLPAINIDSLIVNYGNETNLRASGSISDYEHYDKARINLAINQFLITPADITDFARIGDSAFVAPDILKTLGNVRLKGLLTGSLDNFKLDADAWAKHGALKMVAAGATDTTFENFKVNAKLQTQNFNAGSLMEMPEMGRVSAFLNFNASQSKRQPLSADVKGQVNSIQYNKHTYKDVPFSAYYNASKMGGWIKGNLPLGKFEAKADMTQDRIPKINLDVDVQQLKIDQLIDSLAWKNPELTFHLKGDITGLDMNNIQADVTIEDFLFSRDSLSFKPGIIALKAGSNSPTDKYIKLSSSQISGSITGDYNFVQLPDQINNLMHQYLPGLFPKLVKIPRNAKHNIFNFSTIINNTENLGSILDLPANIIKPLTIDGTINTEQNRIMAKANIPVIEYDNLKIRNTQIDLNNSDSIISMKAYLNLYENGKGIDFNLDTKIEADTVNALLNVKRDSTDLNVDATLHALANFKLSNKGELISSVKFKPTNMTVGKLMLAFLPAEIHNEGERTTISNFGFMEGKGRIMNRYLGIDGAISNSKQDTLNVSFANANLGNILSAFDIENISAIADGKIKLTNILNQPEMYTNNLRLDNIIIFNDTLGDLKIQSKWNDAEGAIAFRAFLEKEKTKSEAAGYVFPAQDSLNLKVNLDRVSIGWIQPFMADMINNAGGSISTGLRVTGKISAPEVRGWLGVNNAYVGIDYTNVTYHISDTIQITPDKIGFDNLVIEDSNHNKARVNAVVTHKNFEDMQYKIDMNLNNLMVLNTAARTDSLFYGRVFASGNVNIKGSDDLIDIKMSIRNGRNSSINVQIPQNEEAVKYQSIVYINTPKELDKIEAPKQEEESVLPIKLSVNLTLTPDMAIGVVIDPLTGDAMQAKGSGLIDFTYDMRSEDMKAFGNYILSDGSVRLKLQSIKTLSLKIKEGSKLVFVGDPLKTTFDISAYRRVKADLATLDPSFASDASGSTKVNADGILGISGNMDKMNLTYDVSLPDASDDLKDRVRSLISTNEQKVKQFAYLLVMGTFYSNTGGTGGNITDGMLTSIASGALSSGLNMLFGNMLGDKWNIGTNISSNDGTFNDMDMSISVSRKFLDEKLEFNTNLGYRTDNSTASDNSFIGDFDVAYALTRSLKFKVFNKTNDRYYKQAAMTQGIGLVYTREAKTIRQLFNMFRKKKFRNKEEIQTEGGR